MSPALVAEYQTRLPDKKLLQAKLHEFYALAESQTRAATEAGQLPVAQLPPPAKEPKRAVKKQPKKGHRK